VIPSERSNCSTMVTCSWLYGRGKYSSCGAAPPMPALPVPDKPRNEIGSKLIAWSRGGVTSDRHPAGITAPPLIFPFNRSMSSSR
jgi:hypothetical protein